MSTKRSACDRCHRLKMQCQTDGRGQQCNRCRSAKLQCNYSKPGRPGRPPTKTGKKAYRRSAVQAAPTDCDISLANHPLVGENTWRQNAAPEQAAADGIDYHLEGKMPPCPHYCVMNGSSDTECLHLGYTDCLGEFPGYLSVPEAQVCPPNTPSEQQSINQAVPRETGLTAWSSPQCLDFKTASTHFVDQEYMQHLAHFQITIARMIDCEVDLGSDKLEQEGAHVLERSIKFLELVQMLESAAKPSNPSHQPNTLWDSCDCIEHHRCRGSQMSSYFNIAIFFQLTSISMRLLEMHYWLYSSIFRCLQRGLDTTNQETTGNNDKGPTQPTLFAIAGVRLDLIPHFRLQLLLHTAVHYLSRIQKTLGELEALRFAGTSEGSAGLPLSTRRMISEDRTGRMAKIRLVLASLKHEFGIYANL